MGVVRIAPASDSRLMTTSVLPTRSRANSCHRATSPRAMHDHTAIRPPRLGLGRRYRAGPGLVAAWSVDRLGRSLQDLIGTLGELQAKGVGLYLHQEGIDTTTPAGKALFQMLGVFAEFETAMIRERTRAGLVRARAQGKRLGRPPITRGVSAAVLRSLAEGMSIRNAAKLHRVGISTVQRIKSTT